MPRGWPVGFRTATAQRSSLLSAISYLAIVTWLLFSLGDRQDIVGASASDPAGASAGGRAKTENDPKGTYVLYQTNCTVLHIKSDIVHRYL